MVCADHTTTPFFGQKTGVSYMAPECPPSSLSRPPRWSPNGSEGLSRAYLSIRLEWGSGLNCFLSYTHHKHFTMTQSIGMPSSTPFVCRVSPPFCGVRFCFWRDSCKRRIFYSFIFCPTLVFRPLHFLKKTLITRLHREMKEGSGLKPGTTHECVCSRRKRKERQRQIHYFADLN